MTRAAFSPRIPQASVMLVGPSVFLCSLMSFVVDSRLYPMNNVTDNDIQKC
jgi:hypothetical protein